MISNFQKEMYNGAMQLCNETDADVFYYKDFTNSIGDTYRIFNYRLASYTQFMKPFGLDMRGTMFQIDPNTKDPIRLASLPPQKFFNAGENPLTMNLDYSNAICIMDKRDRISYIIIY